MSAGAWPAEDRPALGFIPVVSCVVQPDLGPFLVCAARQATNTHMAYRVILRISYTVYIFIWVSVKNIGQLGRYIAYEDGSWYLLHRAVGSDLI